MGIAMLLFDARYTGAALLGLALLGFAAGVIVALGFCAYMSHASGFTVAISPLHGVMVLAVTVTACVGSRKHESSDGVVPYHSAHLDGVASELVVPSDHSVQKSQDAIREVRRILLDPLGSNQVPARPPVAQIPDLLPAVNR